MDKLINYVPIIIAILLFIVLITIFKVDCESVKESWTNYQESPLGNYHNGVDPLQFYNVPRYRMPYRYPAAFYTQHPVPHSKHYN